MAEVITCDNLSNREFLEKFALPGRIGLAGGPTVIDMAIGRAQRHLSPTGKWGTWTHAFLFQGTRHDGRHWVIESDLQIHRRHIHLGVQENRIDKMYDESSYTRLAVLDFDLTPEQTQRLLSEALELVAGRTRYSIRELIGTLLALRHPSLRTKPNLLERDRSFYCSAFVHHIFRQAGMDLMPGVEVKHTTPQDLWHTIAPHKAFRLQRPEPKPAIVKLQNRVRARIRQGRMMIKPS